MLLVLWVSPWALFAQTAKPPSLKEQLEAQYPPGTVLTIQKEGILGVAPTSSKTCAAKYQGGNLKPPEVPCTAPLKNSSRLLTVGEKVNPSGIQVNLVQEKISFGIVECDSCNKGTTSSSYKAQIEFQFSKAYLEKGSVSEIEDTISKVLSLEESADQQTQPTQDSSEVLTNSDVVKMVKAKLGDGIVISTIKSSACNFDTSVDGMVKLKTADVSDAVIQAMRNATCAEPQPASLDVSGHWTATSMNSKRNGPVSLEVDLDQRPDGSVTGRTLLNGTVIAKSVGTLQGDTLNYTSTQIITNCPGTFTGAVTFAGDTASGHYEGTDCRGSIQDGAISMSRRQESPPANEQASAENPVAGHYVSDQKPAEYLDLGSDGKFFWKVGGRDFSGSYFVSEDALVLRFPPVGATAHGKLDSGRFTCCSSNGLGPGETALLDDESKNWVRQGEARAAAKPPGTVSYSFRHRHSAIVSNLFSQTSETEYYCSGTLSVSPDGTVAYDCAQTDDPSSRCEHVSFGPGALKQVKIGLAGNLHLESKTQGKFDFYGNRDDINQAQAAIAPLIQK